MAEKLLGLFGDSNNQTINDLDKDSRKLKQISTNFHMLLRERYESRDRKLVQVACFFETKSTAVKKGLVKKDLGQIVTAESATLAGYNPIPINADHRTMCKFPDDQTTGYIAVTGMLKQMISNLEKDVNELESDGKTIIKLGDVKHGDYGIIYGIVSGHAVGTTANAVNQQVSHTFIGDNSSAADRAIAAWIENKHGTTKDKVRGEGSSNGAGA
ncbi:hypothetical protein DL764_010049 [Monosporascus ibericus]|uniref:Uncharacterized protein n=1 Tax=Monosporascus ibericus TaxID=155417 RepID=A0A4V1X8T3_9PEZI|nr:hypothetical protein DL764_010049 [Monosporascus ibericus]